MAATYFTMPKEKFIEYEDQTCNFCLQLSNLKLLIILKRKVSGVNEVK